MDPEPMPDPPKPLTQKSQKKSSKKFSMKQLNLDQFLLLKQQQKQKIKQFVIDKIKPITFKNKEQLQDLLKDATNNRYFVQGLVTKQKAHLLFQDLNKVCIAFKELQVSAPISDVFVNRYVSLLALAQKQGVISNQELLSLWQTIPAKNLQNYLQILNLTGSFRSLPTQNTTKTLISLLSDNKLQTCCIYYRLYKQLPQFQKQIFIPKLASTDQLYTPAIIDLLKVRPQLKRKVIENVDLAKAVIVLEHLGEDPREYETVHRFILRKHYKSMMHEYADWFVFEDKMCFNPLFIQWFCQEKKQELDRDIIESIRFRNGLECNIKQQKVPNPLYKLDAFTCAEHFMPHPHHPQPPTPPKPQYLTLQQYNISQQQVYFIDNCKSKQFIHMTEVFKKCKYIGFDAQYRCTSTKYQQMGVALIQLANGHQIFLIDFLKLETQLLFKEFFMYLLKDPEHLIVGHSVQGDIKFIQRTMKIQGLEGFVDISKLFKQKFPNQTQNSLPFMTSFIFDKNLSKYEQRSNWNRRPLKKSQSHYAALDAHICLKLYQALKCQQVKLTQAVIKNKKKTIVNLIRKQNIVYQQDQQILLGREVPKFLVDSMLKRLCSLLRNLGIDAEYVAVSNYQLMQETAKNQERIILTRDRKLLNKKTPSMPIYCIAEKGDSDLMLEEIIREFHINLSNFTPLSRCVKCNCPDLEIINREEAMKYLNFQYQDDVIQEFWRCLKCKQIYWQGNQFKNAKKKFGAMSES